MMSLPGYLVPCSFQGALSGEGIFVGKPPLGIKKEGSTHPTGMLSSFKNSFGEHQSFCGATEFLDFW